MNNIELSEILIGCRQNNRASQQRLYALFYNYAMTVARRYGDGLEIAEEITNDAFFKIFTKIDQYQGELPFKQWLRRIVINTAIDRYRANLKTPKLTAFPDYYEAELEPEILDTLSKNEILALLERLPPAYKATLNLYVVDGFSHEEISQMLGISVGGSKSNLSRARQFLKNLLEIEYQKHKDL